MPKDYKDAPAPRAESRLNHPLLLGVIIGLLLGIVISLAVALWLNRLSNPFMEKGRSEAPGKMTPGSTPPADAKAPKPSPPTKAAEADKPRTAERPRFEFYQMLPGDKEVTESEVKAARKSPQASVAPAPPPAAPPSAPRPGSSPASPKPHSGEIFWLQAGAFSEEREADNLKARIALTGLEATVRAVNIPDKGTLYRVRLGPYQSLEEANRMKTTLTQNGVSTAIIRTEESR
jgi:cell division protein FtsN